MSWGVTAPNGEMMETNKPARGLPGFAKLSKSPQRKVALALQGGGLHVIFQVGVLQEILPYFEQNNIEFDVLGTSGGSIVGCVAASGWLSAPKGQRAKGASDNMERLILEMDRLAPKSLTDTPSHMMNYIADRQSKRGGGLNPMSMFGMVSDALDFMTKHQPAYGLMEHVANHVSGVHPLEGLISKLVDFTQFNRPGGMQVFANTVNAISGKSIIYGGYADGRLGDNRALTAKAIAAAGSLPHVFGKGVVIDEVHNLDGGLTQNPPVTPLYDHSKQASDIIVVRVSPVELSGRHDQLAQEALNNRAEQLRWSAALQAEMTLLPRLARAEGRDLNFHVIHPAADWPFDQKSKVDPSCINLLTMRKMQHLGHLAGRIWLEHHASKLGQQSTYETGYHMAADMRHHLVTLSKSPKVA